MNRSLLQIFALTMQTAIYFSCTFNSKTTAGGVQA